MRQLAPTQKLLVKILGQTGSDNDGIRAAAALQAHRLITEAGFQWDDVITFPTADRQPESRQRRYSTEHMRNDDLALAEMHIDACTDWEKQFLRSVAMRQSMSVKQRDVVRKIAQSLRARGFM